MNKIGELIRKHPEACAWIFIASAAWGAHCAFRGGMYAARIRDAANLAASEALGG